MGTTKTRLIEVMDALGLKQYELATTCEGITKNMLQNLWNSATETVTTNVLEPFCRKYPEVNCNWLLRGEGSMFKNTENTVPDTSDKAKQLQQRIANMSKGKSNQDEAYDVILSMLDMVTKTYEFFGKKGE